MFVVDLTLQICLETDAACLHSIEVMKNTRIPKRSCGWSSRQIAPGKSG